MLQSAPHDLTIIEFDGIRVETEPYPILYDLQDAVKLALWPMINEFLVKEASRRDPDATEILRLFTTLKPIERE